MKNPDSRAIYNVMPEIMKLLEKSISSDKKVYRYYDANYIPDDRSGYETYGYDNKETIRDRLFYISDRFNATFRLRWLRDGIDGNHF
jgi:hypothetical protein